MTTATFITTIRRVLLAALLLPLLVTTGSHGRVEAGNGPLARSIDISTAGPLGAVSVIGDSVLLGSALWGPTLPDQLAARGWGPIKFRAGQGYNATGSTEVSTTWWIRQWRSTGWDAPNVIVNIGANDSGTCVTNIQCARTRIQGVIDEVGPGRVIWWPKITRFYTKFAEQQTWNAALQEFADALPNFHTWEWPDELAFYNTTDGTHLSPTGYRKRSARMADLFTITAAQGTQRSADVALPSASGPAGSFVALPAERVVDSRTDGSGRRTDGATLRVDFGDSVPDDATAVALYLGAAGVTAPGFFSAGPCGAPPSGSTLNFTTGPAVGAPTIVALGTDDDVCVFSRGDAQIVIDLQGAFVNSDGLGFTPLAQPERLVDTRAVSDRTSVLEVSVPAGSTAVALNLTAVRTSDTGFLSAAPCGESAGVANVNYRAGVNAAAFAIVNVSDEDTVCVTRSTATDVIVDITGTFASGDGLRFVPVAPTRVLDTRSSVGGFGPIHGSGQTAQTRVAPSNAEAVTGTLTIVRPFAGSFLSANACTGNEATSSVNAPPFGTVANSITTAVTSTGRLCFTALTAGHTIFDTTGWWVAS